jgi:hypothetical protein
MEYTKMANMKSVGGLWAHYSETITAGTITLTVVKGYRNPESGSCPNKMISTGITLTLNSEANEKRIAATGEEDNISVAEGDLLSIEVETEDLEPAGGTLHAAIIPSLDEIITSE